MHKVLIVEDEPWLADGYMLTLQKHGFDTKAAHTAVDAIEQVDEYGPNVVIIDMMLGKLGGMQLLHELRSHADLITLPVIICSNAVKTLDKNSMQAYNVSGVLDKTGLTPDQLIDAVKRAL